LKDETKIENDSQRNERGLRYYPVICIEGLGKTANVFSREGRLTGRDSNPAPPEYKFNSSSIRYLCHIRKIIIIIIIIIHIWRQVIRDMPKEYGRGKMPIISDGNRCYGSTGSEKEHT
jgi:hypothetical protein